MACHTMRMAQIGKIDHFQIGEDWESYEECLQQYFKANGITVYKLLRNLVSPSKPAATGAKVNCQAERLKFRKRIQKPEHSNILSITETVSRNL